MISLTTTTSKVIINIGLKEEDLDLESKQKISSNVLAAISEMRAAGILDPIIESGLGTTAIALVCNDLLNVDSGNVKISKAYMYYLPILQSLETVDLEGIE